MSFEDKKNDSLQSIRKKTKTKTRKEKEKEKIDGGQSKHPEETAFRTGIKVIAER